MSGHIFIMIFITLLGFFNLSRAIDVHRSYGIKAAAFSYFASAICFSSFIW